MCNVGFAWNKSTKLAGGGWMIRNDKGVVMCHSRRAFRNIHSFDHARLVCDSLGIGEYGKSKDL